MIEQSILFKKPEIPRKQLEDLGFIEIKEKLFLKQLPTNIKFYRDYRKQEPISYAYRVFKRIDPELIKENETIKKIEEKMGYGQY